MRKRSLVLATAALAATLAPAGVAQAGAMKTARFVAYVEGKQVTTWNIPRYDTYRDCQGQRWHEGKGSETISFRTKPTRILVVKLPLATEPQVKVGTWSRFKVPNGYSIFGKGKVERTGQQIHGIEPGVCHDAGDPTQTDTGPYDCGTRPFHPDVIVRWRAGRVEVEADDLVRPLGPEAEFANCPIIAPTEAHTGAWTGISQRYPLRDLFDRSQGLVEVLGRETWTEKVLGDHGTATTTTTFKLRLRRAT